MPRLPKPPTTTPSPSAPHGWAIATLCLLLTAGAPAAADTGVSPGAPDVLFYAGLTETCCGEDPHPVHGVATPDGGTLVVGKTATDGGWGGFAVKVGPPAPVGTGVLLDPEESPAVQWWVQLGSGSGKSALLNAAANGSAVFLAGLSSDDDGHAGMYLAKHALEDGALIWERRWTKGKGRGAIEAIQLTDEGGLIAVGVTQAPEGGLEGFKSFGNPFGGQAHALYLSPEQVASESAPGDPAWERTYSAHETIKAVRPLPGEEAGFILLVGREEAPPGLILIDDAGEPLWERSYPGRFEATDVALHTIDGEHLGYTFTGHGGQDGALDGQLTRVDLDGEVLWAQAIGDPVGGVGPFAGLGAGEPQLIFDECWGVQGLQDGGAIVACGTGIEGCELVDEGALKATCQGDPRRTWRGYLVRVDDQGQTLWHRVDSFVEQGADDGVADAASEYVALLPDGGFLSVVDQGFGIGLLALAPEGPSDLPPPDDDAPQSDPQDDPSDRPQDDPEDDPLGDPEDAPRGDPGDDNDPEGDAQDGCQGGPPSGFPGALAFGVVLWAVMRRRRLLTGGPPRVTGARR